MTIRDLYELVRIQLKREEGQTMAEYGLLLALVAVIVAAAVTTLQGGISGTFNAVAGKL
jgi:pilus assembly protein Flp/PilA